MIIFFLLKDTGLQNLFFQQNIKVSFFFFFYGMERSLQFLSPSKFLLAYTYFNKSITVGLNLYSIIFSAENQ